MNLGLEKDDGDSYSAVSIITKIIHQTERATALRRTNILKAEQAIKDYEEVFGPVKDRLVEMVVGAMIGLKDSLEAELTGIGLVVMQTVMDLEIASVAGLKHT